MIFVTGVPKINSDGSTLFEPRSLVLSAFLIFLLTSGSVAQTSEPYLLLSNNGGGRQILFYEGDVMRFRVNGEKHFIEDHILGLSGNTIRFHYYTLNLEEIEAIDIRGKHTTAVAVRSVGGKLIFAGIALLGIDQLNQVVIRDEPAGVSTGIAITSGSLVAAGLAMSLSQRRYFRPGKKRFIQIVDPRENVFSGQ